MRTYKVKMFWYSEVEVKAKNKQEAEEKGKVHEYSEPHLDRVEVELMKAKNKNRELGEIETHKTQLLTF